MKDWLTWRDPTGSFRTRLTAMGAYKNGCIDMGEENQMLVNTLKEQGIPATMLQLTDSGSVHTVLGPADLALVAGHAVALSKGWAGWPYTENK